MHYEVSATTSHGKYQNGCLLNVSTGMTTYLMCIYKVHMCILMPNRKFLCLPDHANYDNTDDGQSMIV